MATETKLLQLHGFLPPTKIRCKHHPASQEGILLNDAGGE